MFYRFIRLVVKIIFPPLFFLKFENKEVLKNNNISGGCIIAANHISLLDPVFILASQKRKIHFMGKAELFKFKFLGYLFSKMLVFPVDRSKTDIKSVKYSLKLLNDNEILGIFPQGTRVSENHHAVAKQGVAKFALKSGCPVIPVGISTKNNKVRLFKKVTVKFGEPIYLSKVEGVSSSSEGISFASEFVMKKINQLAGTNNE